MTNEGFSKEALDAFLRGEADFPDALVAYSPLMGYRVKDDACNLPVALARQMPMNTVGNFSVTVEGRSYGMQLAKANNLADIAAIRLASMEDDRFKFEAHVRHPRLFLETARRLELPFLEEYTQGSPLLVYEIMAKVEGTHHRPMRARSFIPWAFNVLKPFKPEFVMAEWEPDSDNHAAYYRAIAQGKGPVEAVQQTWTHQQFSALGLTLIPKVSEVEFTRGLEGYIDPKVSPEGYPSTVIRALYRR